MRRSAPVTPGKGLAASLIGAGEMAGHVVTGPLLHRYRTRWGASPSDVELALPGDELIPGWGWGSTRAVRIDRRPDQVWPWIVQLGQGRGGFYSLEGLERLVGCQIRNIGHIEPAWQELAVGDPIRLHPKAPPLRVVQCSAPTDLVLAGVPDPPRSEEHGNGRRDPERVAPRADVRWSFHLRPAGASSTRLIERHRVRRPTSPAERLSFGPYLLDPVSFVMSRHLLRNVATLAQRQPR